MCKGAYRKGIGMTLIEVLTVIVIVAILVGILVPVLYRAKNASKATVEISQLHQIGLAQAIYSQESGHVGNLDLFVSLGMIPRETCFSPQDKFPKGIANDLVRELAANSEVYANLGLNYPSTYVGFREYHYPDDWYEKYVLVNPNPGWLLSWTPMDLHKHKSWLTIFKGKYRRLLFDTSVVSRQFETVDSKLGKAQHPLLLFSDPSQQWKEKFISTAP